MKTILKIVMLVMFTLAVYAQEVNQSLIDKNVRVELKDGTSVVGVVKSIVNGKMIINSSNLGELTVELNQILKTELVEGQQKNGQFWFSNPHSTRYFWAPSAYTLKKGEGYYQNAYLFVNSVTYGFTDNFTMGGGFVLNPTFRDWQVLFINPKFSFPSKSKLKFGVGAIVVGYFNRIYDYSSVPPYTTTKKGFETNSVGILYANSTYGTKEHNASFGMGYGFAKGEFASSPVFTFSYMNRFHKNVAFVSENWGAKIDSDVGGLLSGGIRIFGERLSVDVAGVVPFATGSSDFFLIPYVDVVYKFGKK